MMNGSLIFKLQQQESRNQDDLAKTMPDKHSLKNTKLARNYYHRISEFAKEQLVRPESLHIHKEKQTLKPAFSTRSISDYSQQMPNTTKHAQPQFVQDQPMLFGSYRTGTERLISEIVKNQSIDSSPSKKVIFGNEIALLNLRPVEKERNVGRSGRFRQKGQTAEQEFLDRLSKNVPIYLPQDSKVNRASTHQLAESDIRARMRALQEQGLPEWEKSQLKKPQTFVPHGSLHKKTYFNALQKMLTTPQQQPVNQSDIDPKTWGEQKILENALKHPPPAYSSVAAKLSKYDESEWYDNFIEPQNMIAKKASKATTDNSQSMQRHDSMKTSPSAILQQVLRQVGHSQPPAPKRRLQNNSSKAEVLQQLQSQIKQFGHQSPNYGGSMQRNDSVRSIAQSSIALQSKELGLNLPSYTRNEFLIQSQSIQRL